MTGAELMAQFAARESAIMRARMGIPEQKQGDIMRSRAEAVAKAIAEHPGINSHSLRALTGQSKNQLNNSLQFLRRSGHHIIKHKAQHSRLTYWPPVEMRAAA